MAGPVDAAGGSVAQFLCHGVGGNDAAGPVGFHHGDGGGGASDFSNGLARIAQLYIGPAAVRLFKAGDRQVDGGIIGIAGEILAADIAGFGAMVQNTAPVAGLGQDDYLFTLGETSDFGITGTGSGADVQITAIGGDYGCCSGDFCDVIAVTVAITSTGVFHPPPGAGTGYKGQIAVVRHLRNHRTAGRRRGAHIQITAVCGYDACGKISGLYRQRKDAGQNEYHKDRGYKSFGHASPRFWILHICRVIIA